MIFLFSWNCLGKWLVSLRVLPGLSAVARNGLLLVSLSSLSNLQAQQETQKAALSYERAVSMHTAAREMVYVAEQGLMADGKNTLDPTWQEMLNHATAKVRAPRPAAGRAFGAALNGRPLCGR